ASACASGAEHPTHVLAAMGYRRDLARGSLRLSLGAASSEADVDAALAVLPAAVAQLRRAAA
ncbi:MAG: cysteine desulfurase NifS, partial [bacterium]|nr:cysteine desulfurase NifS [bacterium]